MVLSHQSVETTKKRKFVVIRQWQWLLLSHLLQLLFQGVSGLIIFLFRKKLPDNDYLLRSNVFLKQNQNIGSNLLIKKKIIIGKLIKKPNETVTTKLQDNNI
jgi:hypothetical protein